MKKYLVFFLLVFLLFLHKNLFFKTSIKNDQFSTILKEIKNKKYKYAIFDISCSFWEKSVNDLLSSYYDKEKKTFSFWKKISYSCTLAKLGVSFLFGTLDTKKAFLDFLSYFKGTKEQELKNACRKVWEEDCKNYIFVKAKKFFEACKNNGVVTILTDVCMRELYTGFCKEYSFDYLCTSNIEMRDGCITGNLIGEPCSGKGKYHLAKDLIKKKFGGSLKDAIFFANSYNDICLLEKVERPVVVNPISRKLKKIAKKRGWPILKFKELVKN